jgi:hypothetical protein
LKFLDDKLIFREHIFQNLKTDIEEDLITEMKKVSDINLEIKENEQNSMIPHEIISDLNEIFGNYWIKYWRIYVTIAALFYIIYPLFPMNYKKK